MKRIRTIGLCLVAAFAMSAVAASSASALKLCVPTKENTAIKTPKKGPACAAGFVLTELGAEGKAGKEGAPGPEGKEGKEGKEGAPGKEGKEGSSGLSETEKATLEAILPYIQFVGSGVGGKPTLQVSGANLQIVNGEGITNSTNGAGNLIIGYDSGAGEQSGSHNLILGFGQTYTSWGTLIGGGNNTSLAQAGLIMGDRGLQGAAFASVTGGFENRARGLHSWVGGGFNNEASGEVSSVSGGQNNGASGPSSSVSGGGSNRAVGDTTAILGGLGNVLVVPYSHFP